MSLFDSFEKLQKNLIYGESYFGYIKDKSDAVLVVEACRRSFLPLVRERLNDFQREAIRCGSVFVFQESKSGIKRWTDGLVWTPSRNILGFIHYREVDKIHSYRYMKKSEKKLTSKETFKQKTDAANLKEAGFHKKSISYELADGIYHLICYSKIPETVYPQNLLPSNIDAFKEMKFTTFATPAIDLMDFRMAVTRESPVLKGSSPRKITIKNKNSSIQAIDCEDTVKNSPKLSNELSKLEDLALLARESYEILSRFGGEDSPAARPSKSFNYDNVTEIGKINVSNLINIESAERREITASAFSNSSRNISQSSRMGAMVQSSVHIR